MEARVTRGGLAICVAGLLLLFGLWLASATLDDGAPPDSASSPLPIPVPSDGETGTPDEGKGKGKGTGKDLLGGEYTDPRAIRYRGTLADPTGTPIPGVIAVLFGRRSAPTAADGSFTIPIGDGTDVPAPQTWPYQSMKLLARGKTFPPVQPSGKGFTGVDELRVPSWRGPRIRLWWFAREAPAADLPVVLRHWRGVMDEGRTNDEGLFEPLWLENQPYCDLDVGVEGGPVRYRLGRRQILEANPFHIFVPSAERALRMVIEVVDPAGRPVENALVKVQIVGPSAMELDFKTGANGRDVARFWLTDAEEDPSHAETQNWRAWWLTPDGSVRRDEGRFAKPMPAAAAGLVRIELGREPADDDPPLGRIPVLVRGAAPRAIKGNCRGLFVSYQEDPPARRLDPEGRRPREVTVVFYDEEGEDEEPADSETFTFEIRVDGRRPVTVPVPVGRIRKSLKSRETIVLDLPTPTRLPRWVEVVTSKGHAAAAASIFLHGPSFHHTRMTDGEGRAYVGDLPAESEYRIAALDLKSGEAGEIFDYRAADSQETVRLTLLPAKPLSVRVRRPSGAVPGGLRGSLVDRGPGSLLPPVFGVITDDDMLVFPATSLPLYRISIRARKGSKVVSAENAPGTIILD